MLQNHESSRFSRHSSLLLKNLQLFFRIYSTAPACCEDVLLFKKVTRGGRARQPKSGALEQHCLAGQQACHRTGSATLHMKWAEGAVTNAQVTFAGSLEARVPVRALRHRQLLPSCNYIEVRVKSH